MVLKKQHFSASVLAALAAASLAFRASAQSVAADGDCPVIPFLAITGRPTAADVAAKVAALKADGFDQFIAYARSGLQYRYMGEEWLATIEACCREAEKRGMKVWLYDEFNWPSGTCKGRVPAADENFRYSEWALYPATNNTWRWEIVKAPAGWVNVCEPEAIKFFIQTTHEVYEKRLAKHFAAKTIPGIFTDEPGHPTSVAVGPDCRIHFRRWCGMEDEYRAATGRDFRTDVERSLAGKTSAADGETFDPGAVWATYLRLMGRRFRTAYFDPIRAWCDKMGIVLTGHLISENSLVNGLMQNGDPLVALKGESLPGMDEIFSFANWNGGRIEWEGETEWLTYATAQHAIYRVGNGGLVELYACGPNDMTGMRMRQMVWMCALHGVDHYLTSMQVMDHRGLVEKHGYLSPMQHGQPWHGCLAGFFDDARKAAALARRKDVVRHAAVRQPFAAGAAAAFAGKGCPAIVALLRAFDGGQLSVDLVDENEKTDLPFVFEALADGSFRETRTGTVFAGKNAAARAADWLRAKTPKAARFFEPDGSAALGLVVREWSDGTLAAVDVLNNGGTRRLRLVRGGRREDVDLPSRGALALGPQEKPPTAARTVAPLPLGKTSCALDRDNVFRLPFATNRVARFTVKEPLKGVRFVLRTCAMSYAVTASGRPVDDGEGAPPNEKVLRHVATPYAFALDGKPLAAARPCTALPDEFRGLYAETEAFDLAPGVHEVRLVSGEDDRNYFLPAAFAAGRFAVADRTLAPLPVVLAPGAVAAQGLANYCGAVTYVLDDVTWPDGADALRLDIGNAFARVRWNGRDLGARGWAPYEWTLPADGARRGRLEIVVYTSVWNAFGDHERRDADWDARFWVPQHDVESAPGLHAASFVQGPFDGSWDRGECGRVSPHLRTVDLSGDVANQHMVAAGTPTEYQGHPTTALLDDGKTVLCTWPTCHGGYAGKLAVSADAGLTWKRVDERLPPGAKRNVECSIMHRIVGPDGKARLWIWSGFRTPTAADAEAAARDFGQKRVAAKTGEPMPALLSEDDGLTWREMPSKGPEFRCVLPFQAVIRLKDGSHLGIYHRGPEVCVDRPPLELVASVTKDGGFTWSEPRVIARDDDLWFCEPWAFRSPDGNEICVLIRENHHHSPSKVIFSSDEGRTWTKPQDAPIGLNGHRHQGVMLKDGRYVVCMRDMEKDSPTWGHFVAWVGSYESIKTGRASSGDYRVKLLHSWAGRDCGYPGVHLLADGTVLATTYVKYRNDDRLQSVVSVRFNPADADALAAANHGL